MTWREMTIAKILLIVAVIVSNDPEVREQIRNLSNHITVHGREAEE